MLWLSRGAVVFFGVTAWVVSYLLASVGLGANSPNGLVPGILTFGVLYAGVGAAALILEYRAVQQSDLRDIERDGYGLANELRLLGEIPLEYRTTDLSDGALAQLARSNLIVAHYEHRMAPRARRLSGELRRYQNLPKTDVYFRLVDEGPKDDGDVFQIAGGLERLLRQLREGVK